MLGFLGDLVSGAINANSQAQTNKSNVEMNELTNRYNEANVARTNYANMAMNDATNEMNYQIQSQVNASNRAMQDQANITNIALNDATNASNRSMNRATNEANARAIDETNAQNYKIFQETNAREDNAVQRRVADLQAAGLSPTLAAGSAASTGSPITLQAPQAQAGRDDQVRVNASRDQATNYRAGSIGAARYTAAHIDPIQVANFGEQLSNYKLKAAQAESVQANAKLTGLELKAKEIDYLLSLDPEVGKRAEAVLKNASIAASTELNKSLTSTQKEQAKLIAAQLRTAEVTALIQEKFGLSNAAIDASLKTFSELEAGVNWAYQNNSGRPTNQSGLTQTDTWYTWQIRRLMNHQNGIFQDDIEVYRLITPETVGVTIMGNGVHRTGGTIAVPESGSGKNWSPQPPETPQGDMDKKLLEFGKSGL